MFLSSVNGSMSFVRVLGIFLGLRMYPLAGESGHVNGDWLSVNSCGNPGGLYATSGKSKGPCM